LRPVSAGDAAGRRHRAGRVTVLQRAALGLGFALMAGIVGLGSFTRLRRPACARAALASAARYSHGGRCPGHHTVSATSDDRFASLHAGRAILVGQEEVRDVPRQGDSKKTAIAAAIRRPPAPQRELVKLSLLLCPRSEKEPAR
jgi:hypothetical protein